MDQIISRSKTYFNDVYKISSDSILSDLDNKVVMVTGAYGLIGSFITDVLMTRTPELNGNITVVALGRNEQRMTKRFSNYIDSLNFKYICQDINIPVNYKWKVDYIIHLASNAHPWSFKSDPVGTITANIFGLKNILDYAKDNNVTKVLYTSSGEVYGEADSLIKEFKEEFSGYVNPISSRSCYPNSKRCAETLCVSYAEQYWIDTVIARPSHTYGPNMTENDTRVYAEFLRNIIEGKDIILKSEGKQIRSYTYIADCVEAFFYVLLKGENKNAYNVANPNSTTSIKNMAEVIAKIGGGRVIMDIPKWNVISNPMQCGVLNTGKLLSLGFIPKYDLEIGYTHCINILKEIGNY